MEFLIGALVLVALVAIVLRFAPRAASGRPALPRVVDESLGMWILRSVTRRPLGPRDDDDAARDIPLETLEARLGSVLPATTDEASERDRAPASTTLAAGAAATPARAAARGPRPPTLVLPTDPKLAEGDPELAEGDPELPDGDRPPTNEKASVADGEAVTKPGSKGTGTKAKGSKGRRSRRTAGTGAAVAADESTTAKEAPPSDDATADPAANDEAPAAADPPVAAASSKGSGHEPGERLLLAAGASANGSNGRHDSQASESTSDAELAAAASTPSDADPLLPAIGATSPLVLGTRPNPDGSPAPAPDPFPNRSWSLPPTGVEESAGPEPPLLAPGLLTPVPLEPGLLVAVPLASDQSPESTTPREPAAAEAGTPPAATAANQVPAVLHPLAILPPPTVHPPPRLLPFDDHAPPTPIDTVVRQAADELGISTHSLSLAAGATLFVVALVLVAQMFWDQGQQGVLSATGRPGDVAVGASPSISAGASGPGAGASAGGAVGSGGPAAGSAAPSVVPLPTGMPALNRSALSQAVLLDQRLTSARAELQAALSGSGFDATDVAQTLRNISADSVYGLQLASIVGAWPPASALSADLRDFYDGVHTAASDALIQSVRVESAYRQSAKSMVALLGRVKPIDGRARALAAANGAELPGPSPAP